MAHLVTLYRSSHFHLCLWLKVVKKLSYTYYYLSFYLYISFNASFPTNVSLVLNDQCCVEVSANLFFTPTWSTHVGGSNDVKTL